MIRRFRLERKGDYEKLVIACQLAEMLDSFIDGRPTPIEMGSEQGGIPQWDDFVIRYSDGVLEHMQIKNQSIDFCKAAATKPATGGKLSVIDDAFSSLAEWTKPTNNNVLASRKFVLSLSGTGLYLKKDLRVSHLEELCSICQRDGVDVAALAGRTRTDGPTEQIFQWLTTWCNFIDWAHIRSALQRVTVKVNGVEADLKARAITALARHFANPQVTLAALQAYINAEAADVVSISCRPLLQHLYGMLRPEVATWTQYRQDNAGDPWSISGTHGIQGNDLELPNSVVRGLWATGGAHRKLRVAADFTPLNANLSLSAAIVRLALHLQGAGQSLFVDEIAWRTSATHELGHTLGIGENDLDNLPWLENTERLSCASTRELTGVAGARDEAGSLFRAMDDEVWRQVVVRLSKRFEIIGDADLLKEMEAMWGDWRQKLEQDPLSRSEIFTSLLYPHSERRNGNHALRVGPRTVDLIVTAIETLLLTAVAVGGVGSTWKTFSNCGAVHALALKCWSGPAGGIAAVCDLSSEDLSDVVGPSPSPVVVLSGVDVPPSSLLKVGLADDAAVTTSMGAPRRPQLLITHTKISHYLRSGTLESVREYFGTQWRSQEQARQAAIEAIKIGA